MAELLNQGYGLIPNAVLFNKELTDKQKLLFCLISSLCAEKGYCRASNEYLGSLLGVNKRTVSKNISNLLELGFIQIENGTQRKITLVENHNGGCEKSQGGGCEKSQHNITSINNTSLIKESKKEKFLEFVYLTQQEYNKLINTYGERVITEQIKNLNNYIGQNGKDKYKSHYYTILNWNRKAGYKELPPKPSANETGIYDLPF